MSNYFQNINIFIAHVNACDPQQSFICNMIMITIIPYLAIITSWWTDSTYSKVLYSERFTKIPSRSMETIWMDG